jgi:hypothetical protein
MRTGAFPVHASLLGASLLSMTLATSVMPGTALAQPLDGPYRGMYVCEKMKMSPDILRAPIDLVVSDTSVRFGRPLFNWNGTRVLGTEMASGSIDNDGKVHLGSEWFARGVTFQGSYDGTVTLSGGTLTGKQSWHGPDGDSGSRACTVAIVPAPHAEQAAAQQHSE